MKKDHVIAMLEDLQSKFDFVLEVIVPDIQDMKQNIKLLQSDVMDIKSELQSVKAWVNDHEIRITTLEAA